MALRMVRAGAWAIGEPRIIEQPPAAIRRNLSTVYPVERKNPSVAPRQLPRRGAAKHFPLLPFREGWQHAALTEGSSLLTADLAATALKRSPVDPHLHLVRIDAVA